MGCGADWRGMEQVSKTQERSDGIIKPGPLVLPDSPRTTEQDLGQLQSGKPYQQKVRE